jgi:hypothetical protein
MESNDGSLSNFLAKDLVYPRKIPDGPNVEEERFSDGFKFPAYVSNSMGLLFYSRFF